MSTLTKWSAAFCALGAVVWLVGWFANSHSDPEKGANIGAGLLQFAGIGIVVIAAVVCGASALRDWRRSS